MGIVKNIQEFIKYWYIRYLLVTELYMVDTWEKITVQVLMVTLFGLFWYFNYSIVLNGISQLRSSSQHAEQML